MSHNTIVVALHGGRSDQQPWVEALGTRLPDWRVCHLGDAAPADVRYAVAWKPPPGALAAFPELRAIFSLGAGVDHILSDPALPAVPLVRVVDPDLSRRMSEWVVLEVLAHHRQSARYRRQQAEKLWREDMAQPSAAEVRVGVMGLGVLGVDAALKLKVMGFDVAGWSRTPKVVEGIRAYAGEAELDAFLARTQILVVLLPLTPATRGIVDAPLLRKLARDGHLGGPVLINAGRGGLQDETGLLACLDDGTLAAATLDVFQQEPLPPESRFWDHPRVTVTPHCAALTNPTAIADFIARGIEAAERGAPLAHVVDRERSY